MRFLKNEVFIGLLLIGSLVACTEPAPQPIELKALDINAISCMRLALAQPDGTGVCVHGSGMLPGCTDSCAYTVVGGRGVVLAFKIALSGTLVDVETHQPLQGMLVYLILPDNMRYGTRSGSDGTFVIDIPPLDNKPEENLETKRISFGQLNTVPDEPEITIFADLTEQFRARYPKLQYILKEASAFDGKTVYVGGEQVK